MAVRLAQTGFFSSVLIAFGFATKLCGTLIASFVSLVKEAMNTNQAPLRLARPYLRSGLTIKNGGYSLNALLWRGSWSDVFSATKLGASETVCVKSVCISRVRESRMARRELWFHRNSIDTPPTIVSIQDWFIHREASRSICFVMDLCDLSLVHLIDVANHAKAPKICVGEISKLLSDISASLIYLETHQIIHRDIHCGNILWSASINCGMWRLTDFGSCCRIEEASGHMGLYGSLMYASPESIKSERLMNRADVWSLGCCVFESLTLRRPFSATNLLKYQHSCKIDSWFPINDPINLIKSRDYSDNERKILDVIFQRMLVVDWRKRSDASCITVPQLSDGITFGLTASAVLNKLIV